MTDIIRLKVNGEEVYVESHVKGVQGLEEFLNNTIDEKLVEAGAGAVSSVNGKVGAVELTAEDVGALPEDTVIPSYTVATKEKDGLMSKADKAKLDSIPAIEFEVVGTVDDSE